MAKSIEVNTALILLFGFLVVKWTSGQMYESLSAQMRHFLADAHRLPLSAESFPTLFGHLSYQVFLMVAPIMGACTLAALVAGLSQAGFIMTFEPIRPQLSRLNPFTGLARLFSSQAAVEILRSLVKVIVVGVVVYVTLKNKFPVLASHWFMETRQSFLTIAQLVYELGIRIIMTLLVIALLDYMYQRYSFEQNLRMTKEEVKEELKQSEGDPQLRARVRARQREITRRRMMAAVPKAQVVVTNPTHYAVALKYTEAMEAPQVVAKGAGFVALKIKEIAEANRVPVLRNAAAAQTLYKTVEIGKFVPPALYHAVAEIIAYVYKVKGGVPKE